LGIAKRAITSLGLLSKLNCDISFSETHVMMVELGNFASCILSQSAEAKICIKSQFVASKSKTDLLPSATNSLFAYRFDFSAKDLTNLIVALVNMRNVFILAILLVMMQACNLSKLARKDGAFLYKNKIEIKETRESRLFSSSIDAYVKQIPNKRILDVYRLNLRLYSLGNRLPNTWLGRTIQKKAGEAPVILDSNLIENSIKGIAGFLRTEGYFYPNIRYEVSGKIQKKTVKYIISTGAAYHIYKIEQHIADKTIDSLVQSQFEFSHIR
jgi:hypothetical protein